jgi:hypothetical protein
MRGVWPTEVFLHPEVLEERDVSVAEIARFIAGYRLRDNTPRPDVALVGAGAFDSGDRIFDLAVPSDILGNLSC